MKLELIQDIVKFKQLSQQWDELYIESGINNPFLHFNWMKAWVDSYADDCSIYLLTAYKEEELVAIAPLALDHNKNLIFMGYPLIDFAHFIFKPNVTDFPQAVIEHLMDNRQDWRKILLDQIPEDNEILSFLINPDTIRKYPIHITQSDSCPEMIIGKPEEAMQKYNKKHLRNHINCLKKEGLLEFKIYDTAEEALSAMDKLFQLHIDRRDKTPFPSHFILDKHKIFYKTFIKSMFPHGLIKLAHLTLNKTTDLAFFLMFQSSAVLFLYTTSFNDNFFKRSPGQVILKYIMEYAIDNDIRSINFARGDENYKDRYTNNTCQNYQVTIYSTKFAKILQVLFYNFRYSKFVDKIYRNHTIQSLKFIFLYNKRVASTTQAIKESFKFLFSKSRTNT